MKTTFKSIAASSLALMVIASPLTIFAETLNASAKLNTRLDARINEKEKEDSKSLKTKVSVNFCTTLDTLGAKVLAEVGTKETKFKDKKSTRIAMMDQNRKERDLKLSSQRQVRDTKHDTRYDVLLTKATTDAQKAAVASFKVSSEASIAKRQLSIDTAISLFRTEADKLIASKQTSIDANIATFKTSVDAAIATAKASCTSGTDAKQVKETFHASIKSARTVLQTTRADVELKAGLDVLAKNRKASVDGAVATFKVEIKAAQDALKLAFKA